MDRAWGFRVYALGFITRSFFLKATLFSRHLLAFSGALLVMLVFFVPFWLDVFVQVNIMLLCAYCYEMNYFGFGF